MPAYDHLLTTKIDFKKTTERVWAAYKLGAKYDRELEEAPEMARQQAEQIAAEIVSQGGPVKYGDLLVLDTQAVALIAYLQRVGVDLTRTEEAAETPAENAAGDDVTTAAAATDLVPGS